MGRSTRLLEGGVLVALILVVLGVWGFVELADLVRDGESQRLDERVLRALRDAHDRRDAIGPRWVETAALDLTALGGATVLAIVILTVAGYLWIARTRGGARARAGPDLELPERAR